MKNWLKNAIFYEIYPQSFNDTNADGIGDFEGIIQKLDYIKSVGFTAIWMNPCFDSPFTDAGYDVTDYFKAAPRYGTNEDLKRLFDEAHNRDMHILLDLVPGHTSTECKWFRESMKAERNEYSDRYIWTDEAWKGMDGIQGINGILRGISDRDGSCGVNYYSTQPALNYGFAKVTESWQCAVDSESALATRAAMLDVIRFWLGLGCDGFRVDMAMMMIKNDEGGTATIRFWQEVFEIIREEFPNAAFVSEWGEPDKSLLGGFDMDFLLSFGPSHYVDMFHSEKPYFSASGDGNATKFFEYYMKCLDLTHGKGLICLPSGNHDMPRMAYYCDEHRIKLVYAFMMSMPGVPFVYYGDEIGMKYLPGIKSVEGGYMRTGARSPMQWNNSTNSGFSAAPKENLYIMMDPDKNRPTVEKQLADKNSVLNELKRVITVRKENAALQESADFELINDGYPLVYVRRAENKSILVAINPSDIEKKIESSFKLGNTLYFVGDKMRTENGYLIVPGGSATFAELF